jgi:hypothetical protein
MENIAKKILNSKLFRRYTGVMPDFLIIGAQKCGTSSLYQYLTKHPLIEPAQDFFDSSKEVRFFSRHYSKGIIWYRRHFPSYLYKKYFKKLYGQELITGEATPSYVFHPHAPRWIYNTIPNVKLIVLLRNPIDRAYSHYQHAFRIGKETLTFEAALDAESERLSGEREKMIKNENCRSFNYMYYSYLARGIYADQIEVFFNFFKENQILILNFETFFSSPNVYFKNILEFLQIPEWKPMEFKKHNVGRYQKLNPTIRKRLGTYFKEHNERLYELINQNYEWN